MTRLRVCSWMVGLALGLPATAMADSAYTTTAVNLRSGPDADYPLVRWVPEGTEVDVQGCLSDYRWCDVEVYGDRGWMHAGYLVYPYQNQQVPIVTYGAIIGLPILGFSIDYWDHYYTHRPWYHDRSYWVHRQRPEYYPPQHRPPQHRPPQYRPPQARPPQYYPPGNRPPEFRPPQAQPPQVQRPPNYRPPDVRPTPRPDYRPPDANTRPSPGFRPPEVSRPPTARPPGPPPGARPQPGNRPQGGRDPQGLRDNSGERGGMNTGNF